MILWLKEYLADVLPLIIPMLIIGAVYAFINHKYKISYRFFKFFKLANRPILKWLVAIIVGFILTFFFRGVLGLEGDRVALPVLLIIMFLISSDKLDADIV